MNMPTISFGTENTSTLVICLGLLFIFLIIIHYARSPLNSVPNAHWSAGISPLWILWIRFRGRELAVLEKKHRQLGPIVRLGPADLSIGCYEDGARTIYNGGFDKPDYYDFFAYYGEKNSFCSKTKQEHALRRKRITSAYAKSTLFASQPLHSLTEKILCDRLLPIVRNHIASNRSTDVLALSYSLSLDLLTAFQLGLSSASNFLEDPASLEQWLIHYENRYCKESFWPQELPRLTRVLKFFGVDMLPRSQAVSTNYLEDWLLDLCDQAENSEWHEPCDRPVVYQMVKTAVEVDLPNKDSETKRREVASELFDQMSGGREVLGLVLAYTIYHLSKNPQAQIRLQSELAALRQTQGTDTQGSTTSLPSPASLDKLPFMSAVLKESFRMRPNSTPLPRITPKDRSVSLAGIDGIPPNTRVNTFQWLIHRNPENYHQVNEWHPERWMENESKGGKSPLLWSFGGGSRMCIGVSLTQYLMRNILAALYSNFTSQVVRKKEGCHEPGSSEDEIIIQFEHIKGGQN